MKKMRGKPDLTGIATPPKDPTAFLEGGAGDVADKAHRDSSKSAAPAADEPPVPTVQKLFRMRWDIAKALNLAREAHPVLFDTTQTGPVTSPSAATAAPSRQR